MCTGNQFRKLFPSILVALLTMNIIMMVSLQNYTNSNRHGRVEFRPIKCIVEDEEQPVITNQRTDFPSRVKRKNPDPDIERMVSMLNSSRNGTFFPKGFWSVDFRTFVKVFGRHNRSAEAHLSYVKQVNMSDRSIPNWKKFRSNIRRYSLYDPRDKTIDGLLADMATLRITSSADMGAGFGVGTQLKVIVTFEDGGKAIMKPMRFPRDWQVNKDIFVFDDFERHIAEIAAFHLDRLLELCRVPPVVGRKINVTEFYKVAPRSVRQTYFTSPAGNRCFYGKCRYYCTGGFPFCGRPDLLEVSLMAFLPAEKLGNLEFYNQPYKRSYHTVYKAAWEKDENYCEKLKKTYPYNKGKLMNDIIDMHTFDFLNGNKDRHSMVFFREFGNYSFPILFDNGRGYGRPDYDHTSILAPLRQCCRIRQSTFLKYLKLYTGPEKLSVLMAKSLSRDPVAPILTAGNLNALDRRLPKILRAVAKCLESRPINEVILDDSY